jgi:glycosyltransferase involved in cell wall biosynthesis
MVSRLVWWKGVEHGVEAFAHYLETDPDALLVLAGAVGPHREVVLARLDAIPERNYRIIEYEQDIGALYNTFDVLMHLPVTPSVEAWGQVYVEAMAAGVPLVCTRSGIGNELLVDGTNCIVVEHRDVDSTREGLVRLASDPTLRLSIVEHARTSALRYARTPDLNTLDFLYGPSPVP